MVVSRRWAKVCSLEVGWCRCSLVQFISVSVEPTRGACQQMVDQSTMVVDCRRDVRLTAREREVLSNPALGWETKHIAEELGVSCYTARTT